jgi:hypothetical protein
MGLPEISGRRGMLDCSGLCEKSRINVTRITPMMGKKEENLFPESICEIEVCRIRDFSIASGL